MSAQNVISATELSRLEAARRGVALESPKLTDCLDVIGPDGVRFLQNLVTCDVSPLAPGGSARGFFTNTRGGVLSAATVVALSDRFRLILPPARGAALRTHLERYRVVDRVELVPRDDLAGCSLRGARAAELLAALGSPELAQGEHRELEVAGTAVRVRREPRAGAVRFALETSAPELAAVVAALRTVGAGFGIEALEKNELDLLRIEELELAWGIDYGEENFPQETGDEEAVSFTKGCYLGQEVIARIQYRGGVQRLPRRLELLSQLVPLPGVELLAADGRAVGRATTVAFSPPVGASVALALIHRRAAAIGTELGLAGGGSARVVDAWTAVESALAARTRNEEE